MTDPTMTDPTMTDVTMTDVTMTDRRRRPGAPTLLLLAGLACAIPALALTLIGGGGANILMLGPFPSGKVQVVLYSLVPCGIGSALLVLVTATAFRCENRWLGLLLSLIMTAVWLASVPFWGLVMLFNSVTYDSEPETHAFVAPGGKYLLATQPQYDPSAVSLELYRKEGLVYSRVATEWNTTAPASVGAGDFTVVRAGDRAWIAYGSTRLEIPRDGPESTHGSLRKSVGDSP